MPVTPKWKCACAPDCGRWRLCHWAMQSLEGTGRVPQHRCKQYPAICEPIGWAHRAFWRPAGKVAKGRQPQSGNTTKRQTPKTAPARSTKGLLAQRWWSFDPQGPRYWGNTSTVLAQYWQSTGGVLARHGRVLVRYWRCTGTVQARCWQSTGGVLAKHAAVLLRYWHCTGAVLARCWQSIGGVVLARHGAVLVRYWQSTGGVLARHGAGLVR